VRPAAFPAAAQLVEARILAARVRGADRDARSLPRVRPKTFDPAAQRSTTPSLCDSHPSPKQAQEQHAAVVVRRVVYHR